MSWPEHVRDRATALFQTLHIDQRWKWHAFVGVGWVPFGDPPSELLPGYLTISNVIEYGGNRRLTPDRRFHLDGVVVPQKVPFKLCTPIGAPLAPKLEYELRRNLQRCVNHGVHPLYYVRLLAEAIWTTARFNPSVGSSLLGMVIPRPPEYQNRIMFMSPLTKEVAWGPVDTPMFFNIPGVGAQMRWNMPNLAAEGRIISHATFQWGLAENQS
jgi:hypothetical protein